MPTLKLVIFKISVLLNSKNHSEGKEKWIPSVIPCPISLPCFFLNIFWQQMFLNFGLKRKKYHIFLLVCIFFFFSLFLVLIINFYFYFILFIYNLSYLNLVKNIKCIFIKQTANNLIFILLKFIIINYSVADCNFLTTFFFFSLDVAEKNCYSLFLWCYIVCNNWHFSSKIREKK